ncbi:3-dehydroquinate dehydratase [Salinisphaera dokdonensis CL-ES53]|uniref:3-dehydroquinate dehydratase n=1 Tax=Salinisphaera dokdonensis CL-ES53 TaxID=1304272 RepID=A0ABV2B1J7_9GAMM
MAHFLLLNGPNLNLLGSREPGVYGHDTLPAIEQRLAARAAEHGHTLSCFQSNSEGTLIDRLHAARDEDVACVLFNPAAFTHTSVALRDALLASELACIEIHLSNTAKREAFRHHSYFADIAIGTITGFGAQGYVMALDAAIARAAEPTREN